MLQKHIEALIFCSNDPVTTDDIQTCLSEMFGAEVPIDDIQTSINELQQKYEPDDYSFEIIHLGGGYQFLTKPAFQVSIGIFLKQKSKKKLSTSALETLAIIAYKQPITKSETEAIRGVSCDYSIQKLLDKELIEIKGKSDAVGRPILYGTSNKFMEYFGINSMDELPLPKDFSNDANQIGESLEFESTSTIGEQPEDINSDHAQEQEQQTE